MKRRDFLCHSILFASLPLFGAGSPPGYAKKVAILKEPYQTISWVLNDLFPPSASCPDIRELNTMGYFKAVMNDPRIEKSEKKLLINGARRLHTESQREFKKRYYSLDPLQRENILRKISKKKWGDNWLWTLMKYLFESMLCDPVYGANTDGAGWSWLEHVPGQPRPTKVLML